MYFKFMFLNDYELRPTFAKIKFNKLFPNVIINKKKLYYYITCKYSEGRKIIKKNLKIPKKFFVLKMIKIMRYLEL